MALHDELRHLARLPRSNAPFLSLYLNTRWDSEKQRERVRIFVKTKLKECLAEAAALPSEARQGLEEDAERLEHYVRGVVNREWDETFGGVAVFACSGLGEYRVLRSRLPFDQSFTCSDRPVLRAVAEKAHEAEPALLALVNGDAGRLMVFEMGGVTRELSFVDEEFPGRHEQGGWSQARYQRHVEEHLNRNLKRLAEHLIKWADERRGAPVLLSGPDQLLAAFEALLPKRLEGAVWARLRLEPSAAPDVVQAEVLAALQAGREREDAEAVDNLLNKVRGTGRGVAGPEPVAEAVAAGRVHVLYLARAFRELGWKCFSCGGLGVKVPLGCPGCGKAVEGVDLAEELIRGTLAADGKVVAVNGHGGLLGEGGVGAALRYA
ncbi:MAG: Vms1/Ankzf1 family peptidyl-tRNA hydrolase [Deferrisomatales bacterium]|nr:Vms1/Ankzf1 family peptidyl-tRNA hydrolase [Deferrisomatales bacterium]